MSLARSISQRMQATAYLSAPLNRVAKVTAILILLTSSFDIFLVWEAGGNYRFCQVAALLLILLAILKAVRGKTIPVLGAFPLLVWLILQMLFIPATDFWPKSLGYCLWLALNFGLVFSYVQLFSGDIKQLITILRWCVWSFALVASFGVIQFVLPVLGLGGPLVKQWWIPNALPRVNGFSYEPSYFATYMLIGFVFTGSLRRNRSLLLPARVLLGIHLLTATSIVLSSSRIGIAFLLLDVFLSQFRPLVSFLGDLLRLRVASFRLRALVPSFVTIALVCVAGAVVSSVVQDNPAIALMFLNGTGISDTAAHSVIQRESALEDTFTVFLRHPIIGRSLGGVSVAIADLQGEVIHSFEASKDFEGMSVFAEALAASGVIAFIPFVWFLIATIRKPLQLARIASPFYSVLLRALVRSLLFAWAILQFNQNMLRPYLWAHIAILACVYAATVQSLKTPAGLLSSP